MYIQRKSLEVNRFLIHSAFVNFFTHKSSSSALILEGKQSLFAAHGFACGTQYRHPKRRNSFHVFLYQIYITGSNIDIKESTSAGRNNHHYGTQQAYRSSCTLASAHAGGKTKNVSWATMKVHQSLPRSKSFIQHHTYRYQ